MYPQDEREEECSDFSYTDDYGDHTEREAGTSTVVFGGPSGGSVDYDEFGEEC